MDEAEKLDKPEAADKPAGKNSITSVDDYYQEKQTLTGVEFKRAFRPCNFRAVKCNDFSFSGLADFCFEVSKRRRAVSSNERFKSVRESC